MEPIDIVRNGYDALGDRFEAWAERNPSAVRDRFMDEVLARIPVGADVLELGCGPGTAAAMLSEGRRYTGVDLSKAQLEIARRRVPEAGFVRGDLTAMTVEARSLDAVVAFYVFNHVPRAAQGPAFARAHGWLRPGGRLMLSLGAGDTHDQVQPDWLGVPMFFASFDPETNERHLEEAGFELELSEERSEVEEGEGRVTFHWVIARKPEVAA